MLLLTLRCHLDLSMLDEEREYWMRACALRFVIPQTDPVTSFQTSAHHRRGPGALCGGPPGAPHQLHAACLGGLEGNVSEHGSVGSRLVAGLMSTSVNGAASRTQEQRELVRVVAQDTIAAVSARA